MLRRKAMDDLLKWKEDPNKKVLLITGARQVGKTFLVREFGKTYESFISIDFFENDNYANIFRNDRSVDAITEKITLYKRDATFTPGKTLIFLDEIQACPDARTALRFFAEDGRYDVIASGSLLGVKYKEVRSNPAGNIERLVLYSLDFEEFLWANGMNQNIIDTVKTSFRERRPVGGPYYEEIDRLFRTYMIVGGMPEAVKEYVSSHNFNKVLKLQTNIVSDYEDDIAKYAKGKDRNRAKACLRSIPSQLTKRNKKFMFSGIENDTNARMTIYGDSIAWLHDAGIISICHNLSEPALPLSINEKENCFKVYMNDTGLLISMMGPGTSAELMDEDIFVNGGALAENIVAEMLVKNGFGLTYFEKTGSLETDFIIDLNGTVTAIEVKSGNSRKSASLKKIMGETYRVGRGIKLRNGDTDSNPDGIECYPIFAAAFIDCLIGRCQLNPFSDVPLNLITAHSAR